MRISSTQKYVALLALLLCQLTIFAHVVQHAALELDQPCQICVHAPGLDAGVAAPAAQTALFAGALEALPDLRPAPFPLALPRYQPIRAPPSFVS